MPYSSSSVEWSGVRAVLQIVETPFFTGFDHYPLFYSFVRNRVFCFNSMPDCIAHQCFSSRARGSTGCDSTEMARYHIIDYFCYV
jgi:hypothetical protein